LLSLSFLHTCNSAKYFILKCLFFNLVNLKQLDEETKMARFLITIEEEVSDEQSSLSDEQCQNDPGMLKSLTGL
jgi:hypothetical protein